MDATRIAIMVYRSHLSTKYYVGILQVVVRDIISNSRKIVGHFYHSLIASSQLQHKRIQEVTTRWNSTLYMLERLMEQMRAIVMYPSDKR